MRQLLKAPLYKGLRPCTRVFLLCGGHAALAGLCCESALSASFDLNGTVWEKVAEEHNVDPLLLYSVSLVESRTTRDDKLTSPSAYVVRSPAGSRYFDNAEVALKHFRSVKGTYAPWEIDVCAMQINLRWNGNRVADWESLFDLETCLKVGTEVLKEAITSAPGDLELGVGRYHRWKNEHLARAYGRRVISVWNALIAYSSNQVGNENAK